jgi:N4-gp56 family major capsid protein
MAVTNFARLTSKQKIVWSRDVWNAARDQMFIKKFIGTEDGAMIQRITDLTKTEKGERVLIHLVADLVGDGVIGDNNREGMEEELMSYSQEITIDLISHQVLSKGKLAEQKTVIGFREQAKSRLSHWMAERCDQLALLTLSGVSYAFNLDGSPRAAGSPFPNLAFAADVTAPSSKRHRLWNGTSLVAGNTAAVSSACTPNYKMIVDAIAYAKTHYVKPLKSGGKDYYVLLIQPNTLAQLKKDADYQRAVVQVASKSGQNSPWFTGGTVTIDGAVLHEDNRVYGTQGAQSGSKWGAGSAIDGSRSLLCGAQALGMADLEEPEWVEKKFNYDKKLGISVDKMLGFLKPKFYSIYDKSIEDFGVVAIDHWQQ